MSSRQPPGRIDPRVLRTRERLRDALIELSLRSGYEQVSVRDLSEAAGLHRGTFYQHYRDKDDLLLRCMDETHAELRARVDAVDPALAFRERSPLPLQLLFEHVEPHLAFYRWMLAAPVGQPFVARLRRLLHDSAAWRLDRVIEAGLVAPLDADLRGLLIAGAGEAVLGALRWWVAQPTRPTPAWMAERLASLLQGGSLELLRR